MDGMYAAVRRSGNAGAFFCRKDGESSSRICDRAAGLSARNDDGVGLNLAPFHSVTRAVQTVRVTQLP